MSKFSKITQVISGVEQSRDATQEIRQLLIDSGDFEQDPLIRERYYLCTDCPKLKEEFKLFGVTIKDQTPVCGECGCSLLLKVPMLSEVCPLEKW